MLTTFDTAEVVYEAMQAGASGFLVKDLPPEQLAAGIRTVAAGDALLAPTVTRRLIEEFVGRPPPGAVEPPALGELTDREAEVLRLIARGLSNAEIARGLDGLIDNSGTAGWRPRHGATARPRPLQRSPALAADDDAPWLGLGLPEDASFLPRLTSLGRGR